MLAVDASFAIELCLDRIGDDALEVLAQDELIAPPLLWSEAPSVLHELAYRGVITQDLGDVALTALLDNTIRVSEVQAPGLTRAASELASDFGWAKTYDAE
jgi:predicted nucleic acid-binding protein